MFTRVRKSTILSDYVVYLQESNYNIGVEKDPKKFSQSMNCKESKLWYNVMKEEMDFIRSNDVWDLVELPDGARPIRSKWV